MPYNGIDVSEAQGNINWKNVSLSGINFAMIRATYASSGVDSQFINNITKVNQTNIYAGAYHQSNAQNVSEATAEAYHFLNTIKPYKISYPLALNIESEIAMNIGKEFFTNIISSFLNIVKNSGYTPLLYANKELINNYIDISRIPNINIWLSDLTNSNNNLQKPSINENITMWQYSNKGNVRGISGNVNLDISYVNYPDESYINEKTTSENNISQTENEANNRQNYSTADKEINEPMFYTVQNGETLKSIAKKIYGNENDYQKLMELNNITRPIIFAGQTLRVPKANTEEFMLYRVKSGDTLWSIAKKYLGNGPKYSEIMNLNGLTNDMIYPGQILKIELTNSNQESTSPVLYYKVKQGDTLWKIAMNTLGNGNRYIEIIKLNNLSNQNIKPGQIIKIPQK